MNFLGETSMDLFARRPAMMAGLVAMALAGCSNTEGPVSASTSAGSGGKSDIAARSEVALAEFYRTRPGAKKLGEEAKAVLVFPSITKLGLGIGGLGGNGTMFEGGKPVGYYNIAGGSFGLQIGAQNFSQAYFFNTKEALETFRKTKGFQAGVGATAVAADFGADGSLSTSTLQKPLVVATWGQSGLMAGIDIQGAKITEINP
jgi:lipid-binding SYLF domain-containing protein